MRQNNQESYADKLTKRLNKEIQNEKKENQIEIKNGFKKFLKVVLFVILFILLSFLVRWLELSLPPSFEYSNDFYLDKKTQTFDISLEKGNYRLGFYIGKQKLNLYEKSDGNYSLEYYCSNKLTREKKSLYNPKTKNILFDNFNRHKLAILDKFSIPNELPCNDVTLKITTQKNYSFLNRLQIENPITLYVRKSDDEARFETYLDEEKVKFDTKYPKDFDNVEMSNLNESNNTKKLLLEALSHQNLLDIKSILLESNLSINTELGEDKDGKKTKRTPLMYAAYFNDRQTLKYLITHGAKVDHEDYIKKTAIQYAIENNATQSVQYLLEQGIKIDDICYVHNYPEDNTKFTPLTFAVKNEYYELTKLLLEYGTKKIELDCKDIDITGRDGVMSNAFSRYTNSEKLELDENSPNPFMRPNRIRMYHYLYDMQYPVRFLKLFKKYDIKDEKTEKYLSSERLQKDYKKCQSGIYGGKCFYILEKDIKSEEYDIYQYFKAVGYSNRKEKNKE